MFLLFRFSLSTHKQTSCVIEFGKEKKLRKTILRDEGKFRILQQRNIVNIQKDEVLLIIFSKRFNSDLYACLKIWSNFLEFINLRK